MAQGNLPDKIMIVDDDSTVAGGSVDALGKHGIKVIPASDLETTLYQFNMNKLDVVCIELDFEPQPGLILLQKWLNHEVEEKRATNFIILLSNRNEQVSHQLKLLEELGSFETLNKPFTPIQLLPYLSRGLAAKKRALKLGEIKTRAFNIGRKVEKLDKAIQVIKGDLSSLGAVGFEMMLELYEQHSKWPEALDIVDKLLDSKEKHAGYVNAKGRILLKMGDHEKALSYMEEADKLAPDNISRLNDLALTYLKVNQPDDAVEKMKSLIDYHPEDPDMKFNMFHQLQEFGFDEHAQELCKKTASPMDVVRYYNNKGVALSKAGNVEGALLEYERCLMFFPKFKENYRIYYNIALAHVGYKKRSSYEVSIEYLQKCLELKPSFDKATKLKEQVSAALASGKKDKAS